ncbi:hypothetical protein BCR42DRAFT_469972 [Absidia repens]|uniref:VPS10 domain-containing protein n=1 Tax=Absidia repens TaxID=90262 RepID=A0A1X2I6T2_9FUNG|nr:hypothetical protein BCR42DRAFT_469972 [Absidia repens]
MDYFWRSGRCSTQRTRTKSDSYTKTTLHSMMKISVISLALISWWTTPAFAQDIGIQKTGFDALPEKMFYFKDSDVVLWLDGNSHSVYRSENHGKDWNKLPDFDGQAQYLYDHPFDSEKAYVLGKEKHHWKTEDQGKTWTAFETPVEPATSAQHLSFHAQRSSYVLFTGFQCNKKGWQGMDCREETHYTTTNFNELRLLRTHTASCIWSVSSPHFNNAPAQEVMCVESPNKRGSATNLLDPTELRLVQSEDFFHTEQVVDFGTGEKVSGVIAVNAVNQYLVAAVKPSATKTDMDLYISLDGESWHEAVFPPGTDLHEKAYTIVESTGTSLLVDMLGSDAGYGSLYRSNSNGTFFVKSLEHTNRNPMGIIDFERIPGVEGVMLANVVINPNDISSKSTNMKKIQTRMSFDDGSTWSSIKKVMNSQGQNAACSSGDDCALHLHSVTSSHNIGQVFSSNTAIGVIMGVGNYGNQLLEYDECDTYLSTDGGLNWKMVREGAHKYEFGDMGSLLVMVDDEKETDHVWWSKNRGDSWEKYDLQMTVRARSLTTDPESTSRNFILVVGSAHSSDSSRVQSIHLDFTKLQDRQCLFDPDHEDKNDYERWFARDLTDGPDCLMGHEQMFYRRKADRDCYVGRDFQEPEVEMKNCQCTDADYECDYNFSRDTNGKCKRDRNDQLSANQCKSKSDTYVASSGYRLIPGNTCTPGSSPLDAPVDRPCSENDKPIYTTSPPGTSGNNNGFAPNPSEKGIAKYQTIFDDEVEQFTYFADSPKVLMRLRNGQLWYSGEHGMVWKQVLKDERRVYQFIMHEFDNQRAYAILENGLYVTEDQGENWSPIPTPGPPSRRSSQVLDFHPQEHDWLLLVADEPTTLQSEAYISHDHGRHWAAFNLHVDKCIFGRDSKFNIRKETVFCSVYQSQQSKQLELVRTVDWGNSKEVLFDNVVEYFVIEDFMAVAANKKGDLNVYVSINGDTFSEAQFPPGQYIDRDTFTVLQSTTHSILMNIFKSVTQGKAHGALYKSNDNGTFYHISLDNTNGNAMGYVDFEKMQGIDGVILANQVMNADELVGGTRDVTKKVRTMISWDDGGQWQPLAPPSKFDCTGKDCTLNLHSRTDIHGPGAIFTAGGVPGLAMGVGNVGPSLLSYEQSDTFLTRDAGHSWIRIQEGEHLYEFGDQGSILVLINDEGPTNELLYSWDQGDTWRGYTFAEEPIRVSTLTTDPLSSTLKFVIMGHTRNSQRSPLIIVVDFAGTDVKQCNLDEHHGDESDFEKWIAKDDDGDDACLLGKKTAYWRRKPDHICKVGNKFKAPEVVQDNCQCRDIDFECDFGFWKNEKGECEYVNRHPDRPTVCRPGEKFQGRSGYKKNSKSSCTGGVNLETKKDWDCGEGGRVQSSKMEFTDRVVDYIYFTDTNRVIVRTADNKVWRSDDDGNKWTQIFGDHQVVAMYQNPHHDQTAYFMTKGRTHFVTQDRGSNFIQITTPLEPLSSILGTILSFHRDEPEYVIFIGESKCDSFMSNECHSEAFYSHNSGKNWQPIGPYIRSCIWGRDGAIEHAEHDAIFCEEYHDKSGNQRTFFANQLQFVTSTNYFESKQYLFDDMVGVAVFGKYMVVAVAQHGGNTLQLHISLDGNTFALASFPESFNVSPEDANRNEMGIVDFEKMQGIEGIALSNQISNANQANMGDPKKLVTRLTADAGRSWRKLTPPSVDSKKEYFKCNGGGKKAEDCSLHLHSYSERRNSRDLFSSSSAVGLMVGVGNVGTSLTPYRDGDMFLTRDAGKTWNEVYKGAHIWEFADQGGLLMLVDDEDETNEVRYTSDQGLTWKTYEFAKRKDRIKVDDIITQPDGTSQKYVVFGAERGGTKTVAYHIDFSAIHPTQCKIDINNQDDDDFELWSPEDTRGETCLFGRETKYHRRIQDRDCYIGEKLVQPKEIVRNCTCAAEDYECDFNFVRNENNECVLVPGFQPVVPECDGSVDFVYTSTGYRKIAASTCQGGRELDKEGDQIRCPGRGSGTHWTVYLFAPVFGAAIVFGCLRYRHVFRHQGFGSIRLPDSAASATNGIISHPVITKILSAIVIIPVALVGLVSRIPVPHSLADWNVFQYLRLPSFLQCRSGTQYSPLDQDDTDVLLDDYDAEEDSDADEL